MTRIREKKTACSWFSASLVALLAFCLAIAIVPIPLAIAEDVDEATAAEHVEAVVNDEAAEELGEPEETLVPEELSNVDETVSPEEPVNPDEAAVPGEPVDLDEPDVPEDDVPVGAPAELDEGDAPENLASEEVPAPEEPALVAQSAYEGGTIPILRLTFRDDIDPGTGDVILSGDEKITLVNEAINHSYQATGVSLDLEVPAAYDNPESDLWDGVSGYTGETGLELEFIRGRGNSTWRAAKKPYKFKLDKKANLFGMGKSKQWVLIANYYDTSLTVDRLVGWLGDQMGFAFTPRGVPVDLYMNGEYYGNYLLMEEVRVDENRVDIDVVDENVSDLDSLDITGDYLLGVNRKPTALPYEYFLTKRGHAFTWDTPEYEVELSEAEQAQQTYVKAHLERVEDAVYGRDLTNEQGDNAWDLIDKNSLADYWWIQEYTTNRDAFATPSTYFYKLRDTVDDGGAVTPGKLYWGPLWDFDFVWGGFPENGFDNAQADWVVMLRQDPEFVELLKARWRVLDGVLVQATRQGGLLDQYIDEMSDSWQANQERWPKEDQYGWADGSYAEAIEQLREHMEARRAWINAHLDELSVEFYHVTFMDGDETLQEHTVCYGRGTWEDAPEVPEKEGLLFTGWTAADGRVYDLYEAYDEDIVFTATYVDPATVSHFEDIFFTTSELWIDGMDFISYEAVPWDAVDWRIVWSSSDESVVTVDQNGMVRAVDGCLDGADTVRATVTAYLVGSGKSVSLDVVVYDGQSISIPKPESITVEPEMTMEVGEHRQVSYTAEPVPNTLNTHFDLEFRSEDESIAEVSALGVVTAKSPGVTRVEVLRPSSTMDGQATGDPVLTGAADDRETVGFVTVTVTEAEPEPEPTPEPTPEPAPTPGPEPTPTPQPSPKPAPSPSPSPRPNRPSGTNTLPKTGDETPFPTLALMLSAGGACLVVAGRLLRRRDDKRSR